MPTQYQIQRRHLLTLTERMDYLQGKIANCSGKAKNHHLAELAALKWSMATLEPHLIRKPLSMIGETNG